MSDQAQHPGPTQDGPKTIVMCLDGTNDQIGVSEPSNVAKIFRMLSLVDPSRQIAYYDPGIGTLPAPHARGIIERHLSTGEELAFGIGMRHKLTEAYSWLMRHYAFGDRIFVFGFSRGAYTARALVGMLHCPGLLRTGSENLVPYAINKYATNDWPDTPEECQGLTEFADAFCWGTPQNPVSAGRRTPGSAYVGSRSPAQEPVSPPMDGSYFVPYHSVPVAFLGIWDTVEASGVLHMHEHHWRFTHSVPNAISVRHAVAIHEWRNPYRAMLLEDRPTCEHPEEAWFAGVHSDVGGTYEDDHRLAVIALKWVVDGAVEHLILREQDSYSALFDALTEGAYQGAVHPLPKSWLVTGPPHHRRIPEGAWIHQSAASRLGDRGLGPRFELPSAHNVTDSHWYQQVLADRLQISPTAAK
ncbi:DUF2235 domain-containing protein [Allobranchiibius sp. CTAmp26]|uniref:T6SS phospholipase effector Tle1-like catalytic domain-containing protein n=1 Tax=Allobranchiibius sp. CTAmp26 TaxID=2815214 RepID=UPI001AA1AD06|nr:DUF2235 domain-containing protein [Allobranchiibius sp. CTAmp26]MBO1754680.1 DUF2235 domain-containing protein [Allobranchiibius sp. CTAmp26]